MEIDPVQLMKVTTLRDVLRKRFKQLDRLEFLAEINHLELTHANLGEGNFYLRYEARATRENYANIGQTLKREKVLPADYDLTDEKPLLDGPEEKACYHFDLSRDPSCNVNLEITLARG